MRLPGSTWILGILSWVPVHLIDLPIDNVETRVYSSYIKPCGQLSKIEYMAPYNEVMNQEN